MKPIEIPLDYASWPCFRKLVRIISGMPDGTLAAVDHIYLRLWIELGYQGAVHPLGWIAEEEFWSLMKRLKIPSATPQLLADALLDSGVIVKQEEGYFCRMFFHANEGGSDRKLSMRQLRGHAARVYAQRVKAITERVPEKSKVLSAMWPEETAGLDPETLNGAVTTIDVLDAILGRPARPIEDYTLGLFMDACGYFERFGAARVDLMHKRFMALRKEPGLPRTAERILSDIDAVLVAIEPAEGWIDWSKRQK